MDKLIKKGSMVAAVGLVAALQACSSGDSLVENLDPGSNGATITGNAVKGVFADGDCTASTTTGTTLYTSVGKTQACTDSNGNYRIPLMYNPDTPVVVEISTRSTSTMKCDLPAGCPNGVAFGQNVTGATLGTDVVPFKMRSMVPRVTTTNDVTANVNAFTDMAVSRAETAANGLAQITATTVEDSYGEVASLLNNVLSTEGTSDAFTSRFYSVPSTDMTNPTTTGVDSVANSIGVDTSKLRRQSALLSIASSSLLNLASDSKTVSSVLQDLSNSFRTDAQIDVNASAANRAGDSVNLASIVRNIGTTVSGLQTSLASNTTGLSNLATLLNTTSVTEGLTAIQTAAETLAAQKEAVTDANLDPTAPIAPVSSSLSTLDSARQTIAKLVNIVKASTSELDLDEGSNTALEDVGDVLKATDDSYLEALESMANLMEGAASMILDKALNDVTAFTNAGCTVSGDDISCSAVQLASTLDDEYIDLTQVTGGTVVYTHSNRTVTATDVVVAGDTYALVMVGNASTTAPSYSVTSATVDLASDTGTTDISFGTTTVSGVITSNVGQTFTISASDVTMNMKDFLFVADLATTRDITIRDTLVTNFSLSGYVTIASDTTLTSVANDNKGDRVTYKIAFQGNDDSLSDTDSLPMPVDETENDFLAATGVQFSLGYPASVALFNADGTTATSETATVFSANVTGVRNAVKNGDVQSLTLKLIGNGVNASLTGDLTVVDSTPNGIPTTTTTWTLGDNSNVITLTFVETASTDSFSGTVATKAGVSLGTISSTGTVSLTDPADSTKTASLEIALVTNLFN